jgi:hypothetical protein
MIMNDRKMIGEAIYIRVSVRDSSAVRRLFVRLARTVGRQSALHKENSGFATPTLGRHISTFRGYRILFSIRNPYINRRIIWRATLSSSHHAMRCCHHSVNIARSRLMAEK